MHEIHRPNIVRDDGRLTILPQFSLDSLLRSLVPQLQAQVSVNAIGSLDICAPTLTFQQHMYTTIAAAHAGLPNLTNATFQTGLIGAERGVVVGGPIEVQRSTGTPDREHPIPAHVLHHPPASERAQELSPNDVLQHLAVQRQICDDPFQPGVLVFELLQLLHHLRRQHAGILLLPIEVGRLADARLAADLGNRDTFITLLQNERLLRVRKLRCLHRPPFLSQRGKCTGKL